MTTQPAKALSVLMRGFARVYQQGNKARAVAVPFRSTRQSLADARFIAAWNLNYAAYDRNVEPGEPNYRDTVTKTLAAYVDKNPNCTLGALMFLVFPEVLGINFRTIEYELYKRINNHYARVGLHPEVKLFEINYTTRTRPPLPIELHQTILNSIVSVSEGADATKELIKLRFMLT